MKNSQFFIGKKGLRWKNTEEGYPPLYPFFSAKITVYSFGTLYNITNDSFAKQKNLIRKGRKIT